MKMPWTRNGHEAARDFAPTVTSVDNPEDVVWLRQQQERDLPPPETVPPPLEWGAKPPDLLEALRTTYAEVQQRKAEAAKAGAACEDIGTLQWTTESPCSPGLYWWRPMAGPDTYEHGCAALELVVQYGGRLATVEVRHDATVYRGLELTRREWAGPISAPPGLDLERWWKRWWGHGDA